MVKVREFKENGASVDTFINLLREKEGETLESEDESEREKIWNRLNRRVRTSPLWKFVGIVVEAGQNGGKENFHSYTGLNLDIAHKLVFYGLLWALNHRYTRWCGHLKVHVPIQIGFLCKI